MAGARRGGRWVRVPGAAGGRVRDRGALQRHVIVGDVGGVRRSHAAADRARRVSRVAPRQPQGPRRQGA
jgi:hypothetical protein